MVKMKLKDLISQVDTSVYVDKPELEKFITVSSKGNGVRERVISEGKTPVKFNGNRVKSGLLIYSKIGVSDGASGYIPYDLNGAVVSKDFPTFEVNTNLIDKEYLLYILLSKDFWQMQLKKAMVLC